MALVRPELLPINKVKYGYLAGLGGLALAALLKTRGVNLNEELAIFLCVSLSQGVAYCIPQEVIVKYVGFMDYLERVAELMLSKDPALSKSAVIKRMETPMGAARLVQSTNAIADLKHDRII